MCALSAAASYRVCAFRRHLSRSPALAPPRPQVYHNLAKILKKKFGGDATLIGDEGGFAPPCDSRSGIELVMEAIEAAGYSGKCTVGLDVAASEFKVKDSPTGDDALYDLGMWDAQSQQLKGKELSNGPTAKLGARFTPQMPAALPKCPLQGWLGTPPPTCAPVACPQPALLWRAPNLRSCGAHPPPHSCGAQWSFTRGSLRTSPL